VKTARRFQALLVIGLLLRLVMFNQPFFNNSNLRQTQTATITRSIIASGGRSLSGEVNWMGDLRARLLLELPLYNYLVAAVNWTGVPLDLAGKLVSTALWAISFLLLQAIWRRVLSVEEAFWANLLFVLAPVSVFFGQAFLPEMLIQASSFAMLVFLLRYLERPQVLTFIGMSLAGAVGMLLKAPEIAHLYLVAAVMLMRREWLAARMRKGTQSGEQGLDPAIQGRVSPRMSLIGFLTALGVTALAMLLWGRYIDRVNSEWFPEWTSRNVLGIMTGSWTAHIAPTGYFRLLIYLTLLVTTLGGWPWVLAGLGTVLKSQKTGNRVGSSLASGTLAGMALGSRTFELVWVASLLFYYGFWSGGASRIHAYYNLPALGPACLLFGIGCARWLRVPWAARFPRLTSVAPALFVLATAVGPYWFLFHNDQVLARATTWLREHTGSADFILVRINHRTDMCRYRYNSTVAYYAQRNIWPWVDGEAQEVKSRALATASWALVTNPEQYTEWTEKLRRRVKQLELQVEDMSWLEREGRFIKVYETPEFVVYKRK
jgi:hypothetical protein